MMTNGSLTGGKLLVVSVIEVESVVAVGRIVGTQPPKSERRQPAGAKKDSESA